MLHKRSWAVSTAIIGIMTAIWACTRPEQFFALIDKTHNDTTGAYAGIIFTGYVLNLIPDFLSSLQTQRTLEFIQDRHRRLYVVPSILIADLTFKTVLFLLSYSIFVLLFHNLYLYFKQIRDVWDASSFGSVRQAVTPLWDADL